MSTSRAVAVLRMHLTDQLTLVAMPLGILASAFAINISIWAVVPEDGRQTGGALSLWVFVFAAALYAVVSGLPFALGMGTTRRNFTVGTLLTGAVLGLGFGTLVVLLQAVERLTDGWWLHGSFFWFPWFRQAPWGVTWLLLVVTMAAAFMLGALIAAVAVRFRVLALVVGGPLLVLAVGGAVLLLSWRHGWDDLGGWFGDLTPGTATSWSAVLLAVCALGTWASLRRVRVP